MFESSLKRNRFAKSIFISLAISLALLFGGCGDDSVNNRDNCPVLEIMVRIIYSIEDNKRTASSQLIEQFKKYYIPISEIDEKIIKLRHDVFHGKPIAYGEDADISSIKKLCKLNFLINALIMKYIGHSGYIIEIKYYNNDNTQADISFYSYMDIGNLPT